MDRKSERGMVLVACMLILALLSLLGASSLFTATLDSQFVGNQKVNKEAFYSAEAALELGVGKVMTDFRASLKPYRPTYAWLTPQGLGGGDPYANPFNGYTTRYRVGNGLNPANPATEPTPFLYTSVQNGQQMIHFAYTYVVEAEAEGLKGAAKMRETLRALETPLVQYYVFYADDLSLHPGPTMDSWGRIHTNGDLYFAPQATLTFRDFTDPANPQFAPVQLSTSGNVLYGKYLAQNGGVLARASSAVRVRVRNLGTAPDAGGDYENIDKDIDASNQGAEEARFRDVNNSYHVRVGVDPMPAASSQTLVPGGFYDTEAAGPQRLLVDGMRIISDAGGALRITFTVNGGASTDVTNLIQNYQVAAGVNVNLAAWSADALTRADNTLAVTVNDPANRPIIPGTMVYAPGAIVGTDEDPANVANPNFYTAFRGAGRNPRYPCVLECQDGREVKEVDFTVVDLQRLQHWYRDYLDWRDGVYGNQPNLLAGRRLLIYVTRTNAGTRTAGALQAVKLIGSKAGRTRQTADRQTAPTLLVPTTLATDNPLYLDGDFNAPAAAASASPGAFGCALLCDAVTLLSNAWGGGDHYGASGGAHDKNNASETAFNAAFFAGRFDFRNVGAGGEEAGIHNFTRFQENWGGARCWITGCLINLWFSSQAVAGHALTNYYDPPERRFGWDVAFANPNYWPPYVPSIYSIERVAWRAE